VFVKPLKVACGVPTSAKHGHKKAATACLFPYLPQSITLFPPAHIAIILVVLLLSVLFNVV